MTFMAHGVVFLHNIAAGFTPMPIFLKNFLV